MSGTQSSEIIGAAMKIGQNAQLKQRTLLRRWFDALMAWRMQKADCKIREHLKFVPDDVLSRAGYWRPGQVVERHDIAPR